MFAISTSDDESSSLTSTTTKSDNLSPPNSPADNQIESINQKIENGEKDNENANLTIPSTFEISSDEISQNQLKYNKSQVDKNYSNILSNMLKNKTRPNSKIGVVTKTELHPDAPKHRLTDILKNGGKNNYPTKKLHPNAPKALLSTRLSQLYPNKFKKPSEISPISNNRTSDENSSNSDSKSSSEPPLFESNVPEFVPKIDLNQAKSSKNKNRKSDKELNDSDS